MMISLLILQQKDQRQRFMRLHMMIRRIPCILKILANSKTYLSIMNSCVMHKEDKFSSGVINNIHPNTFVNPLTPEKN
jgi:hypothetical protein